MDRRGAGPLEFDCYLVSGPQRSGTTLLHALLCTAAGTNRYIAECTWVTAFMMPIVSGLRRFPQHTRHYFSSEMEFLGYYGDLLRSVLTDIWDYLGLPPKLVLKDPALAAIMPLLGHMLAEARHILIMRGPRDVVASRLLVRERTLEPAERRDAAGRAAALAQFCQEYETAYLGFLNHTGVLAPRTLLVRYEHLVTGAEIPRLETFLAARLRPDSLWTDAVTYVADYNGSPYDSALYGRPMSETAIGSHSAILSADEARAVDTRCGPIAERLAAAIDAAAR